MFSFRSSIGFVVFSLISSSCSNPVANKKSEVQAPQLIGESFVIDESERSNESRLIGIKRSSLEKEFLLQGELIPQAVVAQYSGLKSRIVSFKEYNGQLYMMEATDGHSSSSSLPQHLVLSSFEIKKEKKGVIYCDFAEGMSKIFTSSDWHGQDLEGTSYKKNAAWKAVEISTSYIEEITADKDNNLVIRQIAQVKKAETAGTEDEDDGRATSGGSNQVPVEVKYYLSPYKANEGFVARKSLGIDRTGFFELAPRLEEGGGTNIYATRWDDRKPVVYAISSNTPPEYLQAIKDGVLYWNKAFKKKVVEVTLAPEGVTAPDFYHNLIQWVDWTTAGFAYADAQMDPRTGEILHAQIFLTSVFSFSAIDKARQLLRRLEFDKKTTAPVKFSLTGFEQHHLCDFQPSDQFSQNLAELVAKVEKGEINNDVLSKLANDYLREVVSHEVGHTLGMRHNFAGSLATNIEDAKRDDTYFQYVADGKTPDGVIPSSTVMDYQPFQESVLTGDLIARGATALDYDERAIQTLYFDKKYDVANMPLFCTDSHIGKYIDCATFDYGKSEFDFIKSSEKRAFDTLPYVLMERYIAAKSAAPGQKAVALSQAGLKPLTFSLTTLLPRLKLLKSLSDDAKFLRIRQSTPYISEANKSDIRSKELAYLSEQFKNNGGLSSFFPAVNVDAIEKAQEQFTKLLDSPAYNRGNGAGGDFEFTPSEKEVIKKEAKHFFDSLPLMYIMAELEILRKTKDVSNNTLGKELASILATRAYLVLFTKSGSLAGEIEVEGKKVQIEVPNYVFPVEYRIKAASLLNNRSDNLLWGVKLKGVLRKELEKQIETGLKLDINKIAVEELPDKLALWVLETRKVLASFDADINKASTSSDDDSST